MMRIEQLERRRLFAVTVVETYFGYFEVHGDEQANVIDITVNMDDYTFAFDGTTYSNVEHVSIFGYGGDDSLTLSSSGFGYIGGAIDGGDGNDTLSLDFTGAIRGGAGNDHINLRNAFYGEAYGDDGDDVLIIEGDCSSAEIRGGAGNDVIDARGATCTVYPRGDDGNDLIYGSAQDDVLYGDNGNDTLIGGDGNDMFYTGEHVDGGAGYDIMYGDILGDYSNVEQVRYG